jgi:hypothetical protein
MVATRETASSAMATAAAWGMIMIKMAGKRQK